MHLQVSYSLRSSHFLAKMLFGCVTTLLLSNTALLSNSAWAEEPSREFLRKLREAGYYETALDYLEEMEQSRLATQTFRQLIPFEKASVLTESSRLIRDTNIRKAKLDEAQTQFEMFIEKNPNHDLVDVAKNRLANLLVQRAEVAIQRSEARGVTNADKEKLLTEARGYYQQSFDIYKATREELNKRLKGISPDVTHEATVRLRDEYRSEFLQTLLLMPGVKEEIARTYAPGSAEHKKVLEEAAAEYESVSERYRDWDAAIYAQLYQARCLIKLDQHKQAYDLLVEIFEQVNSPSFRQFKKMALLLAVQCWAADSDNPNVPFQAIEQLEPILATVAETDRDPDWITLRLELAKAYHDAADLIENREPKTPDDRRIINTYRNLSTDLLRSITKLGGPSKREAQELLVEYGARSTPLGTGERPEPTSFAEAKARGREFLDAFETARFALSTLPDQIAKTEDAGARANLVDQQKQAQQTVDEAPEAAKKYFQLAFDFEHNSEVEIAPDDVTSTYYFLAYVLFIEEQYEQVGVIADELMRTAPQGAGSRETADLGLNAYWALYNATAPDNRAYEYDMLSKTAEGIMRQWPGRAEAIKAASLISWVALQHNDVAKAESYIALIPEDAPKRFESELSLGQELWKQYLAVSKQVRELQASDEQNPALAELNSNADTLQQKAMTYLEAGASKLTPENISQTTAIASLSLAQAYVDTDQIDQAINHLENPNVGLLKLLDQGNAAVQNKWLVVNTYKTAVRSYIGALRTSSDKQQRIQQSLAVMSKLEASMSGDNESRQQLISIYVSLANDLRQQMDQLPTAAEKQTFAQGLLAFLDQVRSDATELNTLIWVAQTLSNVGESFEQSGLNKESTNLYDSAGATYEKILAMAKADPSWIPETAQIEIKRQVARNYRNQGDYQKAIDSYAEVLAEKSFIDVQIEAADTYQRWAENSKSADLYIKALGGGEPRVDPKTKRESNTIWGWGKLTQVLARYPQYKEQFFEARFYLAECRFEYGKLKNSEQVYKQAKNDIYQTHRIYPDLGGDSIRQKTDKLLREIQTALGEKNPQGLREFRK